MGSSNSTSDMDHESTSAPLPCFAPSAFLSAQFWLIGVFGNTVALVGIAFNMALLQVLFQRSLRTTYLIYLAVLAIVDILILITYVLVMVVGVLFEYYENYILYRIWHAYIRYFYTISRIATLASTYLVLACTLERYWEVVQLHNPKRNSNCMTQSKRYVIIACVLLATFAFRCVVFMELEVYNRPECNGFGHVLLRRNADWDEDYFYTEIYSFWAVHVVQVFIPFVGLVLLNALIIFTWRSVLRKRRNASAERKKFISRSKSARKMMISIVTSYLICYTLQMVLTCWEHIDRKFLSDQHPDFYALTADAVTLLTAINASSRLPIYYATNTTIRGAIQELWLSKRIDRIVKASSKSGNELLRRMSSASGSKIIVQGKRVTLTDYA